MRNNMQGLYLPKTLCTLTSILAIVVLPLLCLGQGTWVQKFPPSSPLTNISNLPVMAYDAARREIVLFGGSDVLTNTSSNDTWVWNGVNWELKFPTTRPRARSSHAMAYDAARGEVVLFGGGDCCGFEGILGDTWVWDGVNWTQKFPVNSPSPRLHVGMAYDAARAQVVLFGGGPGSPVPFGDTWVWDGTDWTQVFPATSPPARSNFRLAYDAARAEVVLFGGWNASTNTWFGDTWVWDGTTWTERLPASSPPIPRMLFTLAYSENLQHVILFGGQGPDNNTLYDDTWVWDGSTWEQKFPAVTPPGRTLHTMAYDSRRDVVVLFGGFTGLFVADTWVLHTPRRRPR